jgi:hypothetical protein
MKEKIHIVNSKEKSKLAREYFDYFQKTFSYLSNIELVFEPDNQYDKHEEDLNTISRGWSETAELVDTRNLVDYEDDPVRLLLTDKFFELSKKEKNETILHELGHYFTNPDLLEIREYISVKNPKILNINSKELQPIVNAHNTALNFVFQIPKLLQEVSAELWVYKNEPDYSETRIKKYCSAISDSIDEFKKAIVQKGWFYEIPRLNFLILWRLSIIRSLNFDYIDDCIKKTNEANGLFINLAKSVKWDQLKILRFQSNVMKALKDSDIKELISVFEEIFDDFIQNSSRFFPSNLQRQLIDFYK